MELDYLSHCVGLLGQSSAEQISKLLRMPPAPGNMAQKAKETKKEEGAAGLGLQVCICMCMPYAVCRYVCMCESDTLLVIPILRSNISGLFLILGRG